MFSPQKSFSEFKRNLTIRGRNNQRVPLTPSPGQTSRPYKYSIALQGCRYLYRYSQGKIFSISVTPFPFEHHYLSISLVKIILFLIFLSLETFQFLNMGIWRSSPCLRIPLITPKGINCTNNEPSNTMKDHLLASQR